MIFINISIKIKCVNIIFCITFYLTLFTVTPKEPEKEEHSTKSTTHLPTSTFEFPGLEWQEVAVISNSQVSGASLTEVLKGGGLNAV